MSRIQPLLGAKGGEQQFGFQPQLVPHSFRGKKTTPRGDVRLEIPQEIKIIIKREKSSSARLNPCTVTALYQPIKEQ